MTSVHGRLATAVALVLVASPVRAATEPAGPPAAGRDKSVKTQTAVTADARPNEPGRVNGIVTDERGQPLGGAAVTLAGDRLLFAVADSTGRFQFDHVLPGTYLLRVHLAGFAASPRFEVAVGGDADAFV